MGTNERGSPNNQLTRCNQSQWLRLMPAQVPILSRKDVPPAKTKYRV